MFVEVDGMRERTLLLMGAPSQLHSLTQDLRGLRGLLQFPPQPMTHRDVCKSSEAFSGRLHSRSQGQCRICFEFPSTAMAVQQISPTQESAPLQASRVLQDS